MTRLLNTIKNGNHQDLNTSNFSLPIYTAFAPCTAAYVLAYLDTHLSNTAILDVSFDTDSVPLIVDTGATGSFSNKK